MTEAQVVERLEEEARYPNMQRANIAPLMREAATLIRTLMERNQKLVEALKAIVDAEDAALAEWPKLSMHPWTGDEPAMKRLAAARKALERP